MQLNVARWIYEKWGVQIEDLLDHGHSEHLAQIFAERALLVLMETSDQADPYVFERAGLVEEAEHH